jgi:hypothetical protein
VSSVTCVLSVVAWTWLIPVFWTWLFMSWLHFSLMAWTRLFLVAWLFMTLVARAWLFLVASVRRGSCRVRVACLGRRGRARHRPHVVQLGRGSGDARQGKRTAAEDDSHSQTRAWAAERQTFARFARQQACVGQFAQVSSPKLPAPARMRAPRRVSGRSRTPHPTPSTRRSSARWAARKLSPVAHRRRASS